MTDPEQFKILQTKIEQTKSDIAEAEFAKNHAAEELKKLGADTIEEAETMYAEMLAKQKKQKVEMDSKFNSFKEKYADVLED